MKKFRFILVTVLSISVFAGCDEDFLVKTSPDALPEDGFYHSPDRAVAAVNAAYATLQDGALYANSIAKLFEAPSDDIVLSNTTGTEFQTFGHSSSNSIIMSVYSKLYEGVYRSNKVLDEVPQIEMDDALKNRIIGEAKFLRALYYWHLTTLWGEVPLFTTTFEVPDDALVPKSSIDAIFEVMTQDLQDAEAVLPDSYGAEDLGRATRGAAQALLGKIYLYDENYGAAAEWLGRVVNSGTYSLVSDFGTIVHEEYENDNESIFEVQFLEVGSADVQTLRVAYNLPQVNGGFGNHLPVQSLVDEFEDHSGASAINGKDPRLFHSVFIDGDPFAANLGSGLAAYDPDWSPTGYNLKKGLIPIKYENNGGTNFPVIRYADVLLLYAEALNEKTSPEPSSAVDLINEVRNRAGMPLLPTAEYPVSNQQEVFEAIVHERRVELAFEYHRYNDLRRWGLAEEVLGDNGYSSRHRYFPLPQEEIDANPELEQLPGW